MMGATYPFVLRSGVLLLCQRHGYNLEGYLPLMCQSVVIRRKKVKMPTVYTL